MKKLLTFLSFLLVLTGAYAQVGMNQWKIFPSPYIVDNVVVGDGNVYGQLENGIIEYDITEHEQTLWTAANYLSDVHPSSIAFDKNNKTLLIGYEDGNIDLIHNNSVYNMPAILNTELNGNKRINDIEINGNYAYLATGIGVIVINLKKREVKDTYNPSLNNEAYLDVAFNQDSIYVLTASKLYVSDVSNLFLADPAQWDTSALVPNYSADGKYQDIQFFNHSLFLNFRNSSVSNSDTLFKISGNQRSVFLDKIICRTIKATTNKLMVCTYNGVSIYDPTYTKTQEIFQYEGGTPIRANGVCYDNQSTSYFIADNENGLVHSANSWNSEFITFPGPRYNTAYRAKWRKGKLSIASGGMDGKIPTYNRDGGSTEKEGKWKSTKVTGNPSLTGASIWDFLCTAIDPNHPDIVAYGTNSALPVVITKNGVVTDTFGFSNSLLVPNEAGWARISDMTYDDDGNLWMLSSDSDSPLKVLTKDGQWYEFDLGNVANGKYTGRLLIDQNNVKWLCVDGLGLIAFDSGKSIADKSDDKYKVFTTAVNYGNLPSNTVQSIAADVDDNIWVGTPEGMRVLFNTEDVVDASPGEYDFQKLLIKYGANVEIVLGYTNITSIQVDGGNRKWIGTASAGVFLLSPDGLKVVRNFTVDNSPLLSNGILDIAIDRSTGITYFVTSKGMIGYRSDSSQGDQKYTNVKVFPNPVRPDYYGPITIQGIAYNSDVRITDVSGRLVYHTTSNGGTATWNGQTLNGERAKTGVYLIWTSINNHDVKGRKVGKVVFIN